MKANFEVNVKDHKTAEDYYLAVVESTPEILKPFLDCIVLQKEIFQAYHDKVDSNIKVEVVLTFDKTN